MGDNFCAFLFAFLHSKPILKRRLLLKGGKNDLTELPTLKVYPFPISSVIIFWLFDVHIIYPKYSNTQASTKSVDQDQMSQKTVSDHGYLPLI